jgi:hypothetical protein
MTGLEILAQLIPTARLQGSDFRPAAQRQGITTAREGRVRFTHEGYNSSEINFRRDPVQLLKTL